jgi:Ca-activated chloride channel homolog
MTFDRPWVLLFMLLPLAWAAWEWRGSGRRGALLLKAASMMAVLAALAGPVLTVYQTKVALGILVDTSTSMSAQDLERASELATRIEKGRGRHRVEVFPFARATRQPFPGERGEEAWKFRQTPAPAGKATNLEAAIRDAMASLPAGHVPRLLLFSDGHENSGSVSRAIWQAQQLQTPVDTIVAGGRPRPALLLESVTLPSLVFSGERFPIDIALISPSAGEAAVEIAAEGKVLGTNQVQLSEGLNRFRVHANLNTVGAIELTGSISAPGLGEARFENALTLQRPRVLLITSDPPGTEAHLVRTLEANQFEVARAAGVPEKIDDYQLLIFNNVDARNVPLPRKNAVEQFAKQGGGVLWISGERNVYVEKKPEDEDALERTLPAKLAPPRTPEGTAVVLIVDKSSSMEGRKMELARQAAIGVVENLRPIDSVGILIFDNSFQWAVPIRVVGEDKALIKRLIAGIIADGGTQIAPALAEAYRRILPQRAIYKHIVLLTDGISEEGDSMSLSREAAANRVTISTVGLGQDVNRGYLEKVAQLANGRAHMVLNPDDLEQVLLRDVQEHTGSTAVEKPIRASVTKQAEILDGVGIEKAPALRGYVRFIARPTADTILEAADDDPLLVRWQFGLGRTAVFTSDAKSRWAENWVNWPGFDRLWTNVFRDLLPHAHSSEGTAEFDRANNELVVEYRLGGNVREPDKVPDIYAFGPDGFQQPVKVTKMASGYYRGRLPVGQHQGLFRVRPVADSRAFPEVGFYRQEEELREYGANPVLMEQLANGTGGRYNPGVESVFDPAGRAIEGTMALWPWMLGLAILLNLVEIVLRKWKGMLESLRFRRAAEAA